MIVDPVFKGILTGLILSISLGATFFMLVETSITRGLKAALAFDLGLYRIRGQLYVRPEEC
jgi:threonine/homoserine/homoserine lactone efflux protein